MAAPKKKPRAYDEEFPEVDLTGGEDPVSPAQRLREGVDEVNLPPKVVDVPVPREYFEPPKPPREPQPMAWDLPPRPRPMPPAPTPAEQVVDAQAEDRRDQDLADASEYMRAGFTRSQPQLRPVPSRVAEMQQQQGATAAAMKASAGDPTSDTSRRARMFWEGLPVGQQLKARLGTNWEKLPASALPGAEDVLKFTSDTEKANYEARKDELAREEHKHDDAARAEDRQLAMAQTRQAHEDAMTIADVNQTIAKGHLGLAKVSSDLAVKAGERAESSDLRKEFNDLPEVKERQKIQAAVKKVVSAASTPSAAGDLALLYGFNKVLDAGSTVRESELSNAANAAGWRTKVDALIAQVESGQRLSAAQRADFLGVAQRLLAVHESQYQAAQERYARLASKRKVDPEDVIGAASGEDDLARQWAEAHPEDPRAAKILRRLEAQ